MALLSDVIEQGDKDMGSICEGDGDRTRDWSPQRAHTDEEGPSAPWELGNRENRS